MWLELVCFPPLYFLFPSCPSSLPSFLCSSISHQMTYIKDNSRSNIVNYFVFFCSRQLNEQHWTLLEPWNPGKQRSLRNSPLFLCSGKQLTRKNHPSPCVLDSGMPFLSIGKSQMARPDTDLPNHSFFFLLLNDWLEYMSPVIKWNKILPN